MISRNEARTNGYKRYYDGTKCEYGHDSERYTSTGECIICVNYCGRSDIHVDTIAMRHKENNKKRQMVRREDKTFRDTINARRRERNKNPEIRNKNRAREKAYKNTEKGKFAFECRTQLHQSLTEPKLGKTRKCDKIHSYIYTDIIDHIEKYMVSGMTWDNYGTLWNITYRISPTILYDEGIRDIKVVNNLLNLRPVFSNDSPKKRTKTENEYFKLYPDIANQYPTMPDFKY